LFLGFLSSCAKEPLIKEKAQTLIEASDEFQPQKVNVTLTPEQVKKGVDAGYWALVTMNPGNSQFQPMQMLNLNHMGAVFFRGGGPFSNPVISLKQKLGARVVEVTGIQDVPGNSKQKNILFTWTRRFENQAPDLAELFKDQPVQQGRKTFRYGKSGWEIQP
jgi:hypothetical protein